MPPKTTFAPVNVPFERRLQTLCVLFENPMAVFTLCILLTIGILMIPFSWMTIVPMWIAWAFFIDKAAYRGGREWRWLRRMEWLRIARTYFPASLFVDKGASFPSDKNYLFCYHPHGLIGVGIWSNFVPDFPERQKLFPDLSFRQHTMVANFRVPLWRELLLALGFLDCSRPSLLYQLSKKGGGNVSILVPGGAEESIACTEHTLTLKNRKGFIRVAIETGASLVPVFTFGEVETYKAVVQPSRTRAVQLKIQKLLGIGTPLVSGRGIFNYRAGMLPHRIPLNTVVGRPIAVTKKAAGEYTTEEVDNLHDRYIKALTELYEAHKGQHDPEGKYPELKIV